MRPPLGERHEPLPGVLKLPGYVWRHLSRRGRGAAIVAAVLVVAAGAAGAIFLAPAISESKRESAQRERVELARRQAAERRRLVAEQRPVRGRARGRGRPELVALVERAVFTDASRRVVRGELQTRVRRGECTLLDQAAAKARLSCVAVTSDLPATADSRGGISGYPYVGLLDLGSGRYAICKTSGRPAEGALGQGQQAELPRACGGPG